MSAPGPFIALCCCCNQFHTAQTTLPSNLAFIYTAHCVCLNTCSNQGGVRSALTGKAAATSKGKIEALLKQVSIGRVKQQFKCKRVQRGGITSLVCVGCYKCHT